MKRSRRLQPIAKLADRQQQGAARELRSSREVVAHLEEQLTELSGYRADYQSRLNELSNSGVTINKIREIHTFVNKIDDVIFVLKGQIDSAHQQCRVNIDNWVAQRTRTRVVDKLISRCRHDEERRIDSREQGDLDDRHQGVASPKGL